MQKPDIRKYSNFYIFHEDSLPTHQARKNAKMLHNHSKFQSAYKVASEQSGSESGRLQNLVGYARNCLLDEN